MNLLLTSFESRGAGSPQSSRRSDSRHTCSRGCQSLCSDSMLSFCMTAFHQARTSGHQWNSFYYFHLAFNHRDLYYRGYKKNNSNNSSNNSLASALSFLITLGTRLTLDCGDLRETYFFQRLLVTIQRCHSALMTYEFHSFRRRTRPAAVSAFDFGFLFFIPLDIHCWGRKK